VFLFVVMVIALIGTEMFVLTGVAKTMVFESNTAYLRACERNLAASGLAWAKRSIKNQTKETFNRTTKLDVTNMDIQAGSLSVTISIPADKQSQIQINTSCTHVRRTLTGADKYRIK